MAQFSMPALPPLGVVPDTMVAQVVRAQRFGDPAAAFAVEEVAVPPLGDDDVLVAVMAAGGELQQRLGRSGAPGRRHRPAATRRRTLRLPHRRQRRVGHRVRRRRERDHGAGRRRGDRPPRLLGSSRSVDRPRRRPDDRPVGADLGLRHELRLVRAVRPSAGAPGPAQGAPAELDAGGRADPRRHDGLPDAVRLAGQRGARG